MTYVTSIKYFMIAAGCYCVWQLLFATSVPHGKSQSISFCLIFSDSLLLASAILEPVEKT